MRGSLSALTATSLSVFGMGDKCWHLQWDCSCSGATIANCCALLLLGSHRPENQLKPCSLADSWAQGFGQGCMTNMNNAAWCSHLAHGRQGKRGTRVAIALTCCKGGALSPSINMCLRMCQLVGMHYTDVKTCFWGGNEGVGRVGWGGKRGGYTRSQKSSKCRCRLSCITQAGTETHVA